MLSLVLADEGRLDQAMELARSEPDQFWQIWSLAIIYWLKGESEQADEMLRKIIEEHADGDAYQIAEVYAIRGESDEAFDWLERAVEERDPGVTHVRVSPRFRSLHTDPRWPALLKRVGLDGSNAD
jgi:tetratricopeptide (TPR) repeat protein